MKCKKVFKIYERRIIAGKAVTLHRKNRFNYVFPEKKIHPIPPYRLVDVNSLFNDFM